MGGALLQFGRVLFFCANKQTKSISKINFVEMISRPSLRIVRLPGIITVILVSTTVFLCHLYYFQRPTWGHAQPARDWSEIVDVPASSTRNSAMVSKEDDNQLDDQDLVDVGGGPSTPLSPSNNPTSSSPLPLVPSSAPSPIVVVTPPQRPAAMQDNMEALPETTPYFSSCKEWLPSNAAPKTSYDCFGIISPLSSGYCVCTSGSRILLLENHHPTTCAAECTQHSTIDDPKNRIITTPVIVGSSCMGVGVLESKLDLRTFEIGAEEEGDELDNDELDLEGEQESPSNTEENMSNKDDVGESSDASSVSSPSPSPMSMSASPSISPAPLTCNTTIPVVTAAVCHCSNGVSHRLPPNHRLISCDIICATEGSVMVSWAKCSAHTAAFRLGPSTPAGQYLSTKRVFVALLLHSRDFLVSHISHELTRLFGWVDRKSAFVSVIESGSTDGTAHELRAWKKQLTSLGINTRFEIGKIEDERDVWSHAWKQKLHPEDRWRSSNTRIEFLSYLRNRALEPLKENIDGYDYVLFLNDVYFCAEDTALLMLHEGAHLASGIDLILTSNNLDIYDIWVARDIEGYSLLPPPSRRIEDRRKLIQTKGVTFDFPFYKQNAAEMSRAAAFRVFCTWGGMSVIQARVFKHVLFRAQAWPGECSASECTFLCIDIWKLAGPETNIVVEPRVYVTYDDQAWHKFWSLGPDTRHAESEVVNFISNSTVQPVYGNTYPNPTSFPPLTTICVPLVAEHEADFSLAYNDMIWAWNVPPQPLIEASLNHFHSNSPTKSFSELVLVDSKYKSVIPNWKNNPRNLAPSFLLTISKEAFEHYFEKTHTAIVGMQNSEDWVGRIGYASLVWWIISLMSDPQMKDVPFSIITDTSLTSALASAILGALNTCAAIHGDNHKILFPAFVRRKQSMELRHQVLLRSAMHKPVLAVNLQTPFMDPELVYDDIERFRLRCQGTPSELMSKQVHTSTTAHGLSLYFVPDYQSIFDIFERPQRVAFFGFRQPLPRAAEPNYRLDAMGLPPRPNTMNAPSLPGFRPVRQPRPQGITPKVPVVKKREIPLARP
eukprot:c6044_g1_i1.p1 GENE.c6044_g1_i1~~c6044_g1_i1.p1  ORF type:complete len:1059 (+),score=200.33 c6044_g1_i1:1-3177(+)